MKNKINFDNKSIIKNEEIINLKVNESNEFINANNSDKDNKMHYDKNKLMKYILFFILSIQIFFMLIKYSNLNKIKGEKIIYYKDESIDLRKIYGIKRSVVTEEKIFWKNNTVINITKIEEEIKSYENMQPTFTNKEDLYKRENPKVSLIIPIYNQENFIKKMYTCIENQSLKEIEIIFVDDFSSDNSSNVIKELMDIDKRIVYIKNQNNKGVFYSRNIGVINSKGQYVYCADVDDYILNDILIKSYITSITYDLDILQFYVMAGDFKNNVFWNVLKYKSGIIRGNQVKFVFFEGTTRNTWDKFVKRKVFIKSIGFMDNKFHNDKYVVYNDDVSIFGLLKTAKSYGFLEEIGYIYNWAVSNSTTHKYKEIQYTNSVFKSCFTIMEYFYEQTNENFEKSAGLSFFNKKVYKVYLEQIKYLTEGFDYIIKILDLFINSNFYYDSDKKKLKLFKEKILEVQKNKNKK